MQNFNFEQIRKVMAAKKYIFFGEKDDKDYNINLIGVRGCNLAADQWDDQFNLIYKKKGAWYHHIYTITTDPGDYWLEHPMVARGCAILAPGQYHGAYALGLHQADPKNPYEALIQVGFLKIYIDNNKDDILDMAPDTLEEGFYGINIHKSWHTPVMNVGNWSAGCQVFQIESEFDEMLGICRLARNIYGNRFSYTLLDESDFEG